MDSITHAAVGSLMGEVFFGRQLGRKAMVLGAMVHSVPDIDALGALFLDPTEGLCLHRGLSHSFVLNAGLAGLLAWVAYSRFNSIRSPYSKWLLFFAAAFFAHVFLDLFNAYGTGIYEPFSHDRVSLHSIYVVDLALIAVVVPLALVLIQQTNNRKWRSKLALISLLLVPVYMAWSLYAQTLALRQISHQIETSRLSARRILVTPSPFNTVLWFIAIETEESFYTGYVSILDSQPTDLRVVPKKNELRKEVKDQHTFGKLQEFSEGYYTLERQNDTLVFNDLRFGQIAGWQNGRQPFSFHFYLDYDNANRDVMQRGRLSGWNSDTISSLLSRAKGN